MQPPGIYSDWKEIVRAECKGQCVYCSINEGGFGGVRNFHLDHYRPKKKFEHLTNVIENIFYSCSICNSFKGADWPCEPACDHSSCAFPDPSIVNYSDIFSVTDRKEIVSSFVAGKYLIERLFINRPQLVMWRRRVSILIDVELLALDLLAEIGGGHVKEDQRGEAASALSEAFQIIRVVGEIAPYESADTKRN